MTAAARTPPIAEDAAPAERYARVRGETVGLVAGLAPEDTVVQSMPEASPAKWHLAHTTWFFETFLLAEHAPDWRSPVPEYAYLFNSYYESVGEQFPRARRGLLSRPTLDEVLNYRREVDGAVARLCERGLEPRAAEILELGTNHEEQHQELLLTDLKHAFAQNPLDPVYRARPAPPRRPPPELAWIDREGGLAEIGHGGPGFAYDNETPRHRRLVPPHRLASRLVTNAEYLAFVEDGGYARPELWLSDGFAGVRTEGLRAPLHWDLDAGTQFTLSGRREIHPDEPVCHVSFYEADAYARWAGARLPLEEELELALADAPRAGNFRESGALHPVPAEDDAAGPIAQLWGDVWEWTASPYVGYPGYRPAAGAVGEYNGKFMVNQLVLRGGSCVSARRHLRPTYRNFFPPSARWQFTGLRLARDPA